jgi:hypothetical protein
MYSSIVLGFISLRFVVQLFHFSVGSPRLTRQSSAAASESARGHESKRFNHIKMGNATARRWLKRLDGMKGAGELLDSPAL